MREELWVRERLPALLLQTRHREALLPDRALLPTAMCVSETELLQPLLRGSQVLCSGSGRLLCSGSVRCGSPLLPGSGRLLPGSGCLLCSGSVCGSSVLRSSEVLCPGSGVLPGSGRLLCSGSVCGSSVLRSSEVLCSGSGLLRLPGSSLLRSSEMLPGSRDLRLPRSVFSLLPGSGHVLCSVDLCAEVLRSGSGELLRPGRSWLHDRLQHLQYRLQQLQRLRQLAARLARHVPSQQGRLLPDLVHDDEGLLCRSLRSC
ncbi:MAG TPA: hypothetical protein VGP76_23835 [Planctomycetaceae bacterium]|nr:hypothetical protein [Planctomycetaceae bacterium]